MRAWVLNEDTLSRALQGCEQQLADDVIQHALMAQTACRRYGTVSFNESALSAMPASVRDWLLSDAARRLRVAGLEP